MASRKFKSVSSGVQSTNRFIIPREFISSPSSAGVAPDLRASKNALLPVVPRDGGNEREVRTPPAPSIDPNTQSIPDLRDSIKGINNLAKGASVVAAMTGVGLPATLGIEAVRSLAVNNRQNIAGQKQVANDLGANGNKYNPGLNPTFTETVTDTVGKVGDNIVGSLTDLVDTVSNPVRSLNDFSTSLSAEVDELGNSITAGVNVVTGAVSQAISNPNAKAKADPFSRAEARVQARKETQRTNGITPDNGLNQPLRDKKNQEQQDRNDLNDFGGGTNENHDTAGHDDFGGGQGPNE